MSPDASRWIDDKSFLTSRFRTSQAFELVLYEHLPEDDRQRLRRLQESPDFYGVVRPRSGTGTLKAVNRDTALLLFSLQRPGALPAYVQRELDAKGRAQLKDLVLAGILEMEGEQGFVAGPNALGLLARRPTDTGTPVSLASLSRRALQRVAALGLKDWDETSRRLYAYHTTPLKLAWIRRLKDARAVRRYLGLDAENPRRTLSRHWRFHQPLDSPWLSWWRRLDLNPSREGSAVHKLYLSPTIEDLPSAFSDWVEMASTTRARGFKIGCDARGLLRPDKWVVYFDSFEDLSEAATLIAESMKDIAPQGVPFTSEIIPGGLLSRGMDPPSEERLPWQRTQSWRLWIVQNLARHLTDHGGVGEEAVRYALERLRLRGVDTNHWTPSPSLWSQA